MGDRFIIEHDTRGTLVDQDYDDMAARNYLGYVTRWSPTGMRSDAVVFYGEASVRLAWSRIDPKVRRSAKVRRYGSWSHVTEFVP